MPDDNKQLNPQITDILVGTRNLRKVSIYPLSMHDQLQLNDVITQAIQGFFSLASNEGEEESMISFISFMIELIKENIGRIVDYITDENAEDFLKDVTNQQIVEIAEIIYQQNYDSIVKKVRSLFQGTGLKEAMQQPTIKRSPRSVESMGTN